MYLSSQRYKENRSLVFTSFIVLSGYFYVYLNLTGILLFPNLAEFRDTAPLKGKIRKFHVA